MITSLSIKNYALIKELKMTPDQHLNIITGETGAGKSIILGAVGLLLGKRADTKLLLNESEKCIVEGTFDISSYKLQPLFDHHELDYTDDCIIRREISPAGKSRAFINDTPTTLPVLKTIGERLMDVHSQHESLALGDHSYQLEVLDTFASHHELINAYREIFFFYEKAGKKLQQLEKQASEHAEDADYKQFQLEELVKADLDNLHKEELQEELEVLENAEDIKLKLAQSMGMLDESDLAILQQLTQVKTLIQSISSFSKELEQSKERLESTTIELQDIFNEFQRIQDRTAHDPERAQALKERLDVLNRLEKKHHVLEVEELRKIRDLLDKELQITFNLDEEITKAKNELAKNEKLLNEVGAKLTESRKLSALNLADEIEKIIHRIGIENGTIDILIKSQLPTQDGLDKIELLFSANKGIKPQELKEVASGGEFSRLIFAIKFLIADKTALPTLIFDEIDTGVSGEVASQMIQMIKNMAQNHQVISISHLPQFAAGGDVHYFVYKDHTSDRSVSKIRKLEGEERVNEIAKMIGGERPGGSAYESAKELLQLS
ncbi:MAG: DNA repair protein RecN [Bacteroidota bacterium]